MSLPALNTAAVHAATIFLAQPEGADPGGKGEGFGKSTPLGLLLMIVLLIAVALLVRSMTKHLKRVPPTFDPDADDSAEPDEAGHSGDEDEGESRSREADEPTGNAANEVAAREQQ